MAQPVAALDRSSHTPLAGADSGAWPVTGRTTWTPDQVITLRALGQRDHDAVLSMIGLTGEAFAKPLYTHRPVDWVLRRQHALATPGVSW
ncbi:hypothetical protein ACU686_13990 [Yinghuangia aomiensis]